MRTTKLLDDRSAERLRAQARQEAKSVTAFLTDAGRKALESRRKTSAEPFELITFSEDEPQEGIDLDRTNELLATEHTAN